MSHQFDLQTGIRRGASYIYELECVRGLAILLVFLFHAYGISLGGDATRTSLLMSFIVSGNTGVTLFFVLSGFLLSLPWLKPAIDSSLPRPSVANFYTARALRVLPLYYLVVLASAIISGEWLTGARALAFDFVGFEIFPYSVVWWTLSTEVQFYILLPLFFSLWFAGAPARLALLVMFLGWLYLYVTLTLSAGGGDTRFPFLVYKSVFARLPAFLLGILAGYIYLRAKPRLQAQEGNLRLRIGALVLAALGLAALGLVLQAVAAMGGTVAEHEWHIHHTYESALWAALLLLLLLGRPLGREVLVNRAMAITGKLSYSIYLVHVPILFYLIYPAKASVGEDRYLESVYLYLYPLLGLVLTFALSYLTYRLIEMPFLNLKKRLSQ